MVAYDGKTVLDHEVDAHEIEAGVVHGWGEIANSLTWRVGGFSVVHARK
jgi:hypothetical protein